MAACATACDPGPPDRQRFGAVPEVREGPAVAVTKCEQTGPRSVDLVVEMVNTTMGEARFAGYVTVTTDGGKPFATSGLGHIGQVGRLRLQRHTGTLVRVSSAVGPVCTPHIDDPLVGDDLRIFRGEKGFALPYDDLVLKSCDTVEISNRSGKPRGVWALVERFDAGGASLGITRVDRWPSTGAGVDVKPMWPRETARLTVDAPRIGRPVVGCEVVSARYVENPKPALMVP